MQILCKSYANPMEGVNTLLYLDTRRKKNSGLYPLKLQVYFNKEQRYYPLKINNKNLDLSKEDFERSYFTPKPRQEFKELKKILDAIISRADDIVKDLNKFSFQEFEKRWSNSKSATASLRSCLS